MSFFEVVLIVLGVYWICGIIGSLLVAAHYKFKLSAEEWKVMAVLSFAGFLMLGSGIRSWTHDRCAAFYMERD